MEDETITRFTCDFKLAAKFFKNKRLGKEELFTDEKICHVQEFLDFLSVFANDNRYQEIKDRIIEIEKKGNEITMCSVAQALEEKGIEKNNTSHVERLLRKEYSVEQIMDLLDLDRKYVEEIERTIGCTE